MKLNSNKCDPLFSGHRYEKMFINILNNRIWESKNVELLGIAIDKDLKFDKQMNKIYSKANKYLMFSLECKVSCLQKKEE